MGLRRPWSLGSVGQQGSLQTVLGPILCVRQSGLAPALDAGALGRVSSPGPLQVLCLPEGRAATEASLDVEWGAVCSRTLVGSP